MDGDILLFIQEFIRNDILTPFMVVITRSADYGALWITLIIALIIIRKTRIPGHIMSFSLAIEAIIVNLLVKPIAARERPYDVIEELVFIGKKQLDYSFPSGHTGAAFAVAGAMLFIVIFGLKGFSDNKTFRRLTVVTLIYAVLIALSRLYVGVHYPTDVLGGMAIGLLSALAGYFSERKVRALWDNRGASKRAADTEV